MTATIFTDPKLFNQANAWMIRDALAAADRIRAKLDAGEIDADKIEWAKNSEANHRAYAAQQQKEFRNA